MTINDEVTKEENEIYNGIKIKLQNRPVKQPKITENFDKNFAIKSRGISQQNNNSFAINNNTKTFDNYQSISFVRGKGNLNHNNRNFIAKNVDAERTPDNIIIVRESLQEAYKKCFGQSIEEYNETQKQKCRRKTVKSYMEEIAKNEKNSQRTKLFYEQVIQFGTMNTAGNLTNPEEAKKAAEALLEYCQDFQKRNPNLYVFNATLHLDEATPHLHIDYIPVARENAKRGLKVRNAFTQALKEQGINPDKEQKENEFTAWRKREVEELKTVAEKHNIKTFEKHTEKRNNLTIEEYREIGRQATEQAKKEVQAELLGLEQKNVELEKTNKILQEKLQQQKSTVAHPPEETKKLSKIEQLKEQRKQAKSEITGENMTILPKIEEKQLLNSPIEPFKEEQTMFSILEKDAIQVEQQVLKEEYKKISERQATGQELLLKLKMKRQRMIQKAKVAGKNKWFFQNEKAVINSYLIEHGYKKLMAEINQKELELSKIKNELNSINKKILEKLSGKQSIEVESVKTEKPKPKAKLVKSEWQKQREQARNTGRGGMSR